MSTSRGRRAGCRLYKVNRLPKQCSLAGNMVCRGDGSISFFLSTRLTLTAGSFLFNKQACGTGRRFFSRPLADSRSRKEVFQPHLPVRLPCYDLAPVTGIALGRSLRSRTSGTPGFHGLTGGVYKARERIHRAVADARLLANPASWSRVADSNPN